MNLSAGICEGLREKLRFKNMLNTTMTLQDLKQTYHCPVMWRELVELLELKKRNIIVDCTIGVGSHALKFFEAAAKDTYLVGIDRDEDSLKIASERLANFEGRFTLVEGDFSNIDSILKKINIKEVDIFLFDLGISTYQLDNPERGFSFLKEGPLDMRMDKNSFLSAYDLVNNLSETELANIFRKFGEERYAKKIAHFVVEARNKEPIATTLELSRIVIEASSPYALHSRIHPATRIFQALRIAVNRELEVIPEGIKKAVPLLSKHGRIAVISFHSLEDRLVKHLFKNYQAQGILKIITQKPLMPSPEELDQNRPSRSAKLRIAEKN